MSRRTRNNSSVPISLFSFQDIMTTIMGILVLVTLMMALDLWRSTTDADAVAQKVSDSHTSDADLARLREREASLREEYTRATNKLARLAEMSGDHSDQVKQLLARLQAAQQEVAELEERVAQTRAKSEASHVSQEKQAKAEEIVQMEQRAAQLRGQIQALERNPRLTYIVQPGSTKRPILIEFSGSQIGIGVPQQNGSTIWLENPNDQTRLNLLSGVAGNYDPGREYFVILLKPSGFSLYNKVIEQLRSKNFDIGTEVIEEEQRVLVGSDPQR